MKVSEKVEKKYGKGRTEATSVTAKKAIRMSIFTIYEEGDDHSSEEEEDDLRDNNDL